MVVTGFRLRRSGKIWKDGTGKPTIFQATMGAGMWKRYLDENEKPRASFTSDIYEGVVPFTVNFDAGSSIPSSGADSIVSYNWDFGDGFKSTKEKVEHPYKQAKNYIVKLTVTDNLGKSANTYTNIRGYETGPVADFVVSTYHGKTNNYIDFFGALSFDSSENDSIVSYSWNFGDGTTGEGKNITHIFTKSANFTVRLTVTNSAGKTSYVTKSVRVDLNTEIANLQIEDSFEIYPNPVVDELNVLFAGESGIEIYNSVGQLIFVGNNVGGNEKINTKSWNSGVYVVVLQEKGKRFFRKIIKE